MNWDMVGALSEFFGAIAVVASLVYLSIQLRLTREGDQIATFQSIVDGFTEHSDRFFLAADGLALRGLTDRSSLSEEDRLRFDQLLANMLSQLEMSEWSLEAGLLSEEAVSQMDWFLERRVFVYPGAREWLDDFATWYPEHYLRRLRRAADTAMADSKG